MSGNEPTVPRHPSLIFPINAVPQRMETSTQIGKIEFEEFMLHNGLRVIVHEDHSTPIVAVSVAYHVGSKNEDPSKTGFAHLFEHLMFDGSLNVARGEFDRYITKAGGWDNAYTTWDITNYHEVVPGNQLELVLWLEADRMTGLNITEIGIQTQKEVVKEERRWRVDNRPYGTAEEKIFAHAYKRHPYRWPIIGSMEHLDRATLDDVQAFFKSFYTPSNATLVIAGDVAPEEARHLVKKYFDEIPGRSNSIPRTRVVEEPQRSEEREVVPDNVQLPAYFAAYRAPEEGHRDFYPLSLLGSILASGESSRLHRRLVYEKKVAEDVEAYVLPMEEPGLFFVTAVAMQGYNAERLEVEIDREIELLKTKPVSMRELEKVKNQAESSMAFGKQRVDQKAGLLAHFATLRGDPHLVNSEIDRYLEVTPEDISRVAKQYLAATNRTVLHYIPKSELSSSRP
jgi:zinc protease